MKTKDNFRSAFGGLVTPLLLPLLPNQTPDFVSFERLIEFQISAGVDSLWLNGTSGEFYGLRDDERIEVIKVAKSCIKNRVKIIAHVGAPSTRLALDHAENIADIGVDALSLVPPYYIPQSQAELIDHICTVSQVMEQPLFLYHVPSMCKKSLTYDNITKLAEEKALIGLKDSAGDMESFGELVSRTSTFDFCCLNGNSSNLGRGFLLGAHGFAGAIANILPARCKQAHVASLTGDEAALEASQRFTTKFFQVLHDYPAKASFTWLNKWVLKELGVIRHETVFQPFEKLDASGESYMRDNLIPLVQESRPVKASA